MDTFKRLRYRLREDGASHADVLDDLLTTLSDHLPLDARIAIGEDLDAIAWSQWVAPRAPDEPDVDFRKRIMARDSVAAEVEAALSRAMSDRIFTPVLQAQAERGTQQAARARDAFAEMKRLRERLARSKQECEAAHDVLDAAGVERRTLSASPGHPVTARELNIAERIGRLSSAAGHAHAGEAYAREQAEQERDRLRGLLAAAERRVEDHRTEISRLTDKVQRQRDDARRLQALVPPIRITRDPSPGVRQRAEFPDGSACEEREATSREGLAMEITWHTTPAYPAETLASEWAHHQRAALERSRSHLLAQVSTKGDHG